MPRAVVTPQPSLFCNLVRHRELPKGGVAIKISSKAGELRNYSDCCVACAPRNDGSTEEGVPKGLAFFGGEFVFTADFVYLQCIMLNDCETTFCAIFA